MLRSRVLAVLRQHLRYYGAVGKQEATLMPVGPTVAQELVSEFGNSLMIKKLFAKHPELQDSHIYIWKTFTNILYEFGFQPRDCFRMIAIYPSILGYDEKKLRRTLDCWYTLVKLSTDELKFLIFNRPELLSVHPDSIRERIPFLQAFCPSKETLMTFLFLCPNVMMDDWDETMKKLDFLLDEMMVYKTEILTCRAMSKSLEHIKMRFSIVEKCGIYTRPNAHVHKQTNKERIKLNNPKLKDIIDKTDISFAKKIAKISLEEYEVYANAFSYQKQANDKTSDDSDDDD